MNQYMTTTNGIVTCYTSIVIPHKFWYDILMGFKTELLFAYIFTLIFILLINVIVGVNRENANIHIIKKMETENARLEIEKDSDIEEVG